jgi:peptide/nickel transport system permease protein
MPISLTVAIPALCVDMVNLLARQYVTEIVFAWPGMAQYATYAILRKDLNAIIGTTIIVGLLFFIFNLIADLLIFYLDPRMRLGAAAE